MKQTIKLNERELNRLISESVMRVLNEEVEEKFLGGLRDTLGAVKDTYQKGGNFQAHKFNRNLKTAQDDKAALMQRYGVKSGQNANQIRKGMIGNQIAANNTNLETQIQSLENQKQEAISNITAKYDQKIENLRSKFGNKNNKLITQANNKINKYQQSAKDLTARQQNARYQRNKAMNTNPYADFAE